MQIPMKHLKNGFAMPEFGIGTWQMGGRHEHDPANDDGRDIKAIRAAIDLGITHFDTAEQYAAGHSEILLGRAIEGYERSRFFIISKVMPMNKSYDDIIHACKKSLERAQMDYFDMYLLHRVPASLEEAMRAMNVLVETGLIHSIGVANFGIESLKQAQALTSHSINYDQVHYNLEFREPERTGVLEYCQANDILLAGWRPVQKGALLVNPPAVLLKICKKYDKTPAQVAINWLLSQENVITLVKTSSIEHLEENLGSIGWEMTQEDVELLRREYPNQKYASDAVPLDAQ